MHISLDVVVKAGMLPISTVGDPGTQGAGNTGTQGMGVNTPSAAAVAAATGGLALLVHLPKVARLTMGLFSIIFAAGVPQRTRLVGNTVSGHGAMPNEHMQREPVVTSMDMIEFLNSASPFRL